MQLDIKDKAQRDIDMLHAYGVETFGKVVADEYAKGLLDLFDLLQDNPRMGVELTVFRRKMRKLVYRRHLVFYRLGVSIISVVRVLHGKQNWHTYF